MTLQQSELERLDTIYKSGLSRVNLLVVEFHGYKQKIMKPLFLAVSMSTIQILHNQERWDIGVCSPNTGVNLSLFPNKI